MTRSLMTRSMTYLMYKIAGDMLHEKFAGISRNLHDAEEYQIRRAINASSDTLSKIVKEAAEKSGVKVPTYSVAHLYDDFCVMIIPYEFSKETSEQFLAELKLATKRYDLRDVFERTGELMISDNFRYYWTYSSKKLEQYVDLLKFSMFTIN